MNISEIDVFNNGGSQIEPPENEEVDFDDIDCPLVSVFEKMYLEPKLYGVTLSTESIKDLLVGLGYKVVEKDGEKYALMGSEKLSRSKTKREEQSLLFVYQKVSEELAVKKFLNDWNNVFGTSGNIGEA